jgi:hypothetical protein
MAGIRGDRDPAVVTRGEHRDFEFLKGAATQECRY